MLKAQHWHDRSYFHNRLASNFFVPLKPVTLFHKGVIDIGSFSNLPLQLSFEQLKNT